MLKKGIALLVPVAAVVAIALIPVSSASADCKSPPGTPHTRDYRDYCHKFCHVPDVRGMSLKEAEQDLEDHDCETGEIHREHGHHGDTSSKQAHQKRAHDRGRLNEIVVAQGDPPGSEFPAGHEVDLYVTSGHEHS